MPKAFTVVPTVKAAETVASPLALVRSWGVMVTMPPVVSTWWTSVADPDTLLSPMVTGLAPPGTCMAMVPPLLYADQAVLTVPSGTGVGSRTVQRADQPFGFAGSFQVT